MMKIILMLKIALRARRAKRAVGGAGIVGLEGKAVTPLAPEGTVFVRNELWRARSRQSIGEGEAVMVTGLDGVTLKVRSLGNPLATKVRSN